VRIRVRPWALALGMVALSLAFLALLEWRRQRADSIDTALVTRLPLRDTVQFYMDVQALRQSGLLELVAGSRAAEETDYRRFVETSGFDYREDLDAIFVSYRQGRWYCLLRGRFDWQQLRRYAAEAGGACVNGYCQVRASQPNRYVSFYALQNNVLALGISNNPNAAYAMANRYSDRPPEDEMRHPVWVRVASTAVNDSDSLPAGARPLVSALRRTERATLSLGPAGDGFEVLLRARCPTDADAEQVRTLLAGMTDMLRKFLQRGNVSGNPRDLSGVLAGGAFRREGTTVHGRWPVQRVFLEALAEGTL
jgi:hypothetical protein